MAEPDFTYNDLIEWSTDLPDWQRDALRRILIKGILSEDDLAELVELAKAPHAENAKSSPKAIPASQKHIQPLAEKPPTVTLVDIHDIARVNALAEGPIPFAKDGMTVAFGGNATGKSGIVRILRKACRSRDPGGEIRPNVFEPLPDDPPQAVISYLVDGVKRSETWIDGGTPNDDLRTIHVFDSNAAAVLIEQPNLISYTPAILQTFRSLAEATDSVSELLNGEIEALGDRPIALDELDVDPGTEAGMFLASLEAKSEESKLDQLCSVGESEITRHDELERALSDDPAGLAQSEQAREKRLAQLQELAVGASRELNNDASNRCSELVALRATTDEAAEAARLAFNRDSSLDGIGTDVWRTLWESARLYSETHAYPGEKFPVTRDGAVCVLCQQPLEPEAEVRLHSFEDFVKSDIQQRADQIQTELDSIIHGLEALSLPFSVRSALIDVGLTDSDEAAALRAYLVLAKACRRHMLRLAKGTTTVSALPDLPSLPDIGSYRKGIQDDIRRLREAARTDARQEMEKEHGELEARLELAQHRETVGTEIVRLRAVHVLKSALADCTTQRITLKARQAAKQIISEQLRASYFRHLKSIGLAEPHVEVAIGAGEHGKHPFEMKIIPSPDIPPEEILCEGERTCVALAGLLAELETTSNYSAIVLDDPVSSLDHRYRQRVAEQLVKEAKRRQVIIFTHDVVFLFKLRKYAGELGVPVSEISLSRGYKRGYGQATDGPPWVAMSVKQRITALREEMVNARRILKSGNRDDYERRVSYVYDRLRQAWERAVEEILLNQTVLRFGDAVQTNRLSKLIDIEDPDVEIVTKEMTRCSEFIHDESGAVYSDIPEPGIVEEDIRRLHDWAKDLRKHRGR